jgi:hypothetical protein
MARGVSHDNSSTRIRERILANKRLRVEDGKLTSKLPPDPTGCKNSLMLYVEDKHRESIESLIWSDVAENVAAKLEVSVRTIYRWRKRFPLNEFMYGINNRKLPVSKPNGNS